MTNLNLSTHGNTTIEDELISLRHREALFIVERIACGLIKQPSRTIDLDKTQVSISASIGIALYPDNGTTAKELIRTADTIMYRVKNSGKNNFEFA